MNNKVKTPPWPAEYHARSRFMRPAQELNGRVTQIRNVEAYLRKCGGYQDSVIELIAARMTEAHRIIEADFARAEARTLKWAAKPEWKDSNGNAK